MRRWRSSLSRSLASARLRSVMSSLMTTMPVMRLASSRTGMAEWETVLRRPSEVSMSMTSLT